MNRRHVLGRLLTLPLLSASALGTTKPLLAGTEQASSPRQAPPFSPAAAGGPLPAGWTHRPLPGVERSNHFDLLSDGGSTVLRVRSEQAASTLGANIAVDPGQTPWLHWRWKVSNAVPGSDLRHKAGDDYAARVYLLFDLPDERLSFGERLAMATARLLHGTELPAAALCYVWGTAQQPGDSGWNPYTDRVRMLVLDSGDQNAGKWRSHRRDIAADFRAAFGAPVPPLRGIAVSADTDNTGARVEARFGDLVFSATP